MEEQYAQIANGTIIEGINDFDERGRTPLMNACSVGYLQAVIQLLRGGANSNLHSHQGNNETALHFAAARGFDAVVVAMLEHGSLDVNSVTSINDTALFMAAQSGHLKVVDTLLLAGASTEAKRVDGFSPLHIAALKGHSEIIRRLAAHHETLARDAVEPLASPFAALTTTGESVMRLCIISGSNSALLTLLELGADPNAITYVRKGQTPLIEAASRDHADMIVSLLRFGAHLDYRDKSGLSALDHAVEYGSDSAIRSLAAAGASFGSMYVALDGETLALREESLRSRN